MDKLIDADGLPDQACRARQNLPGNICRIGEFCNLSLTMGRLAGHIAGIVREGLSSGKVSNGR